MSKYQDGPKPKGCMIRLRSSTPKMRGQSAIEFAALVIFLLAAFVIFQKYIARGIYGRWKGTGDAIGQGRIFDENLTVECEFYPNVGSGIWYERPCYEAARDGYGDCYTPFDCEDEHPGTLSGCMGRCEQN